jgi:ribose transport system permease protein
MDETKLDQKTSRLRVAKLRARMKDIRTNLDTGRLRDFGPVFLLLAIVLIGGIFMPSFLKPSNLLNVLWAVSLLGIIAMGQTVLMITANFDLSSSYSIGLVGIVTTAAQIQGAGLWPSIFIGFGIAGLIGFINGLIVVKTKASPFLITLGMGALAYSASLVITESEVWYPTIEEFAWLGRGYVLKYISVSVIIFLVLAVLVEIVLQRTVLGRSLFMIGMNPHASHLSGVRVSQIKWLAFIFSGLTAGLVGLIFISRQWATATSAGSGMEFDSLIAAILGGTSLFGGKGGALRTVVGVLILGVMNNLLVLFNVPLEGQQIAKGALFLGVVWIDSKILVGGGA